MQYLKNPNTNYFDKYGVLKYSSYLPEKDLPLIQSLQNDNIFIKKKLTEIENRINRHSARAHHYADRNSERRLSRVSNNSEATSVSLVPIQRPMAATDKKYRSKTAKYRPFDPTESFISRKNGSLFNLVYFYYRLFLMIFVVTKRTRRN